MESKYFGTDGVRGEVNQRLNANMAYRIGRYLGVTPLKRALRIVIGRDTRISGDMLLHALVAGVTASGSSVYDMGVTSTPSVSYITQKHHFDYGIMISASHNPYFDNGIKIFGSGGEKIPVELECKLDEYIDRVKDDLPVAENENIGRSIDGTYLVNEYIDFLASKAVDFREMKILIDCANGSAAKIAPLLFARLGANVKYINHNPNGININDHCGSTHLDILQDKIHEDHYDIGLAFDGDADRLLAICPDGKVIDGDAIMYIMAKNMQAQKKLKHNTVVLTVMSNYGVRKALHEQGVNIIETPVGDKNVHSVLKKEGYSLGGEQSGHIIFIDDLNTGDGLLTAIKLLKVMHYEKKSVAELCAGLKSYPQKLVNMKVENKEAVMKNPQLQKMIEIENHQLNGDGRVLVRPSGTEQLIRIMAETSDQKKTDGIVARFVNFIGGLE